jgi:[acyl-carrier-protein] S-malonyltransferase
MLADLAHDSLLTGVFGTVSQSAGCDLKRLAIEGPAEALDATTVTQPLMLAADIAFYAIQRAQGGAMPVVVAGHSLGEYAALYAAGVLDVPALAGLVTVRARLMQEAVAPGAGAMAAVLGLDDEAVGRACRSVVGGIVEPVNYNSPGQVVIAGERSAVEQALLAARQAGARKAILLPVSVPAHSSLMRSASRAFEAELARVDLHPPSVPIVHNADRSPHPEPAAIRLALVAQLASPVHWTETVRCLRDAHGVTRIVECGPGRVLTGLGRRIAPELEHRSLENRETIRQYAETN